MKLFPLLGIVSAGFAVASCSELQARNTAQARPCAISTSSQLSVHASARGVRLDLPADAKGPFYDSDDYYASRPTWRGEHWHVHFVFGNGGLTEFMRDSPCCSLSAKDVQRYVCVGDYIYHGAMADISRSASPDKVSSAQVTIEPNGLTKDEALSIVASMVTTWEQE